MTDTGRIRPDEDIPSFEPWVIVLVSVFVPIALAFVFPSIMWICFGITGLIFAASMVMLARQERGKKTAATRSASKG
jgi:hypothetical protein